MPDYDQPSSEGSAGSGLSGSTLRERLVQDMDPGPAGQLAPTGEEIRTQVRCILEDREFRGSRRSQQFLCHVVACALDGEVERLKESIIGSDVFGRAPGYDAGRDSVVRVRASEVRKRLVAYYERLGPGAQVHIELPSGSYVPRFRYVASGSAVLSDCQCLRAGVPQGDTFNTEVLYSLLTGLAGAIAGHCAYIGVRTPDDLGLVKVIAAVKGGKRAENFEYPLAGSPCENVIGKTVRIYADSVRERFPGSAVLDEVGAKSYAGAPLFDCRGGALGMLVVLLPRPVTDIQFAQSLLGLYAVRIARELEHTIAARELYESEQRYRAIFESAGEGILLMRGDRLIDCNPKALELLRCTREQLVGQTPAAFAPVCQPDGSNSGEVVIERTARVLRGEDGSFCSRCQRPDGSIFDAHVTLTRVENMKTPHLVAHFRDVTEASGRRIRESEERFRGAFESAGIGMVILDMKGRVIESNPALQAMLGYGETELAGVAFPAITHPDDVAAYAQLFAEAVRGERGRYQLEKRYIRKDGQIVWGRLTGSVVRNSSGEAQYVVGIVESVAEHEQAATAREKS